MDKHKLLNEMREIILKKYDETEFEGVNENTLILLGLDHLIKEDEVSLTASIANLKREKYKFTHEKNIKEVKTMLPEQIEVFEKLSKGAKNKLLLAPTSFGKTTLIKEYIYRNRDQYKNIAFILPTNALSYETIKSLLSSRLDEHYLIFDSILGKETNPGLQERIIFIGTQEKLISLIEKKHIEIDLLIIDEAYKITEKDIENSRCFILNKILQSFISSDKTEIILLSPIVKFIGEVEEFEEIKSEFEVVAKDYHQYQESKLYELIDELKDEKTIVFSDRIRILSNKKLHEIEFNDKEEFIPEKTINYFESMFGKDWNVIKLMKKGCMIHNGKVPKVIQEISINLFNGPANLLIGTTSITDGINTKAKNVIINTTVNYINNYKMTIKNLIGRAGRMGVLHVGHIFTRYSKNDILDVLDNDIGEVKLISKENFKSQTLSKEAIEKTSKLDQDDNITEIVNHVESLGISQKYFDKIKEQLELDQENSNFTNVLDIYNNIYLKFKTQPQIQKEKSILISLLSKTNKTNYILDKWKLHHNSNKGIETPIESFVKVAYNVILYDLKNLYDIFYYLIDNNVIIPGRNVKEIFDSFNLNVNNNLLGISNKLTDNQKMLALKLFEYGIYVSKEYLPEKSLELLEGQLNIRFSMFDIRRAIYRLSEKDEKWKEIYETFFWFEES